MSRGSDLGTGAAAPMRVVENHASKTAVRVWDLPTRAFHWLLAASFATAWATGESERWQLVHVLAGYTAAGLIAFRLLWGMVGTRHARFSGFVFAPGRVVHYLRSLASAHPEHHLGHNPAGSWAVLLLLAAVALTASTGYIGWSSDIEWVLELHEGAAGATLGLIAFHVAAVLLSSVLHRENLVRAMITGSKPAPTATRPVRRRAAVAVTLIGAVLALWLGWIPAPGLDREVAAGLLSSSAAAGAPRDHPHHERD